MDSYDAKKGAVYNNPFTGPVASIGKALGLGGTKTRYSTNTGDWDSRGINRVSKNAYDNYGDLRNLYNERQSSE